jgi:hypothetical protein
MQDSFNDDGWGCAYRSMQTICSWFLLQHFSNLPVPTHTQIQSLLVELGDKKKDFIGSTQWIGAIEISLGLQHLYGIQCSVLHISSGAEICEKAEQLQNHFNYHGTPVMIGKM